MDRRPADAVDFMSAPSSAHAAHRRRSVEMSEVANASAAWRVLDGSASKTGRGVTAILGPNAAGKSTIIKAILGLTRADAGRIAGERHRFNGDPELSRRHRIHATGGPLPRKSDRAGSRELLRDLRAWGRSDTSCSEDLGLGSEMASRSGPCPGAPGRSSTRRWRFCSALRCSSSTTDRGSRPGRCRSAEGQDPPRPRRRRDGDADVPVLAELEELADDVIMLLEGRVAFAGPLPAAEGDHR